MRGYDVLLGKRIKKGGSMMTEKEFWVFLSSPLAKYNMNPDKGLEYTAHFALEECGWWNE